MKNAATPFRVIAWPAGEPSELNPYVRLMLQAFQPPDVIVTPYRPRLLAEQADAFLIQWPEAIFHGRFSRWRAIAAAKARSIVRTADRASCVALTVHNLTPHAAMGGWKANLWRRFHHDLLKRTDLLIALSPQTLAAFRAQHPEVADIPVIVVPHPHYRDAYPSPPKSASRAALTLPESGAVIGIIGSLRPSKMTPAAIRAFRASDLIATLLVAGDCDDAHWAEILGAAGDDSRIALRRGRLSSDDLAAATIAADLILLNQTEGLNSGTALLALSLGRPVLAPATPAFTELADEFGPDWVRTFSPPLDQADLAAAVEGWASRPAGAGPSLADRDPAVLSRRLLAALRDCAAR